MGRQLLQIIMVGVYQIGFFEEHKHGYNTSLRYQKNGTHTLQEKSYTDI